jgi:Flp pilus assembly protein TadD
MIEIEQPKRAENVESARLRIDAEDYEGAVQILKPLRNWLADYWKLWGMLASAYNHLEQYPEAEDAARRLLNLFPACEPAYGELRQALAMQGKNEEAYNVLRFAASNMPSSLPIHVNLGLAARQAGHEDEAKELAKRIREVVGPNEELEPVLAEMEGLVTSP